MRLLQYHDPVNVSSESSTRGTTNRSRSFSCTSGCLTWSEDGLQRQLRPNVAQLSILFTNIDGVFVTPGVGNTVGLDIRRKNQVVLPITGGVSVDKRSGKPKGNAQAFSWRWVRS